MEWAFNPVKDKWLVIPMTSVLLLHQWTYMARASITPFFPHFGAFGPQSPLTVTKDLKDNV